MVRVLGWAGSQAPLAEPLGSQQESHSLGVELRPSWEERDGRGSHIPVL